MAAEEVIAALTAIREQVSAARQHISAVLQGTADHRHMLVRLFSGTNHHQAGTAVASLKAATDRLREARQASDAAELAIAVYQNAVAGGTPAPPAVSSAVLTPVTSPAADSPTSTPTFAPVWIQEAAGRLPRRPRNKGPTHGILTDTAGVPMLGLPLTRSDGQLRSGDAPGARAGIRPDWHPLAQVTFEHVEAHAAALLRLPGAPRSAVLVVNNLTCVSRGQYVGCDELLPGMLPQNTELAVYVTDGQRTHLTKVYTGTGEGLLL